jgi:esterase/lipase
MDHKNIQREAKLVLETRHQVSGLNSKLDSEQLSFTEYINHQRNLIARVRENIPPALQHKIIEGNAPFQLTPINTCSSETGKPFKRGVLLTHGLTDSPYFMRHLAAFFQENGFRVMAILLPGHGTQPGDLLEVRWQEWTKAVAYGTNCLAKEVDEIYLAGFSAGGTLSIYQSLNDQRVRGLFLFAPALKISSKAAWAKLHHAYSWLIPAAKWVSILPDRDLYKYESFAKNAAAQMYALTKEISKILRVRKLDIPIFTALSADDATIEPSATLDFLSHSSHPANKIMLYSTDTDLPVHSMPENVFEIVNSVLPKQKILSSAHTAIVLPPEDQHYGEQGEYANCVHYYPAEMDKYNACIDTPCEVFQGEITEQNLAVGTLRRLMYNPHYSQLTATMRKFIEQL